MIIKMNVDTSNNLLKLVCFISLTIFYNGLLVGAQEENELTNLRTTSALFGVKGGSSSKTSGGFSKFKQTITNIQRQQQQQQQEVAPAIVSQQNFRSSVSSTSVVQRPAPVVVQQTSSRQVVEQSTSSQQEELSDSEPAVYGSVSGTPGIDFPNYTSIPNTKFSCDGLPFDPGMYADESTGCQVYHLCYQGRKESFLCGVGTVFNQAIMNCDFWSSVECSKSSKYYQLNAEFGKSSSEPGGAGLQQQKVSSSSSSFVRESQLVVQPPPPAITKTSFAVRQEQSRVVSQPARPVVSRVQESSSFSTSGVKGGKASPARQSFSSIEEIRKSSGGFVSPGRRFQLLNQQEQAGNLEQLAGGEAQLASGSSNRFKMASSKDGAAMELPATMLDEQSGRKAQLGSKGGGLSRTGNEVQPAPPRAPVNNVAGNSEWRPYFKSNSSTTTSTTPTRPQAAPGEPTTLAPAADQEPAFSESDKPRGPAEEVAKLPKSGAPPEAASSSSTTEQPAASLESDVSAALTTTSPAPASSESPPPPPEPTMMDSDKSSTAAGAEASSSSPVDGNADNSSAAPTTTITPPADGSPSSAAPPGEVEGSEGPLEDKQSDKQTAPARESSVEYAPPDKSSDAQSLSSANPDKMTTSADSDQPKEAAAGEPGSRSRRKSKRKKKRQSRGGLGANNATGRAN